MYCLWIKKYSIGRYVVNFKYVFVKKARSADRHENCVLSRTAYPSYFDYTTRTVR